MVIAKTLVIDQALRDRYLNDYEFSQILRTVFDPGDPSAQVAADDYTFLKKTILEYERAAIFDPVAALQYENTDTKKRMQLLLGHFPGNLDHYTQRLAEHGLSMPSLRVDLPELEVDYIVSDADHVIRIGYRLDGSTQVHEFEVDTDLPGIDEHDSFKETNDSVSLFQDVVSGLWELFNENQLSSAEEKAYFSLGKYLDFSECESNSFVAAIAHNDYTIENLNWQPNEKQRLDSQFALPTYSDGSLGVEEIESVLTQVSGLNDPEVLQILKENGYRVVFLDPHTMAEKSQTEMPQGVYDRIVEGIGSVYYSDKTITIDTRVHPIQMMIVIIHEIGHALNVIIQQNQSQPTALYSGNSYQQGALFGGAQEEMFVTRKDGSFYRFPSRYSKENYFEFFAELFLFYTLERAGRWDLIPYNQDSHSQIERSLFLVDPVRYLMMDKIVTTIANRDHDPDSYHNLLKRGIDQPFLKECETFERNQSGFAWQNIISERKGLPDQPSVTLEEVRKEWAAKAVFATGDISRTESDYIKRLRSDFIYHTHSEVQSRYVADLLGNSEMDIYVEEDEDYWAVWLACQMARAKTDREKMIILIDAGLTSEEKLQNFYETLTILDTGEVNEVLNPVMEIQQGSTVVRTTLVNEAHKLYAKMLEEESQGLL